MQYTIRRASSAPELDGRWNSPLWKGAETLNVDQFHSRSSSHRPETQARFLYDDTSLHAIFRVKDQYVRSVNREYQSPVCRDSCVEFFFSPIPGSGRYFNIEINCGGVLLFQYGVPWMIEPREVLGVKDGCRIEIFRSMPCFVDPEIEEPTEWVIQFKAALAIFTERENIPADVAGTRWEGNVYKCADATSHPHWASWSPVGEVLNFHKPECFQPFLFAPK